MNIDNTHRTHAKGNAQIAAAINAQGVVAGNALFLILIAVALFAALSYAVTQSSRGGGTTAKEKMALEASEMMQYAAEMQLAVTRLTMTGCAPTDLNFASSKWASPANYVNPAAVGTDCNIFDPAGGGVTWRAPPPLAQSTGAAEYGVTSGLDIRGGISSATKDLVLIAHVTSDMCDYINARSGIPAGVDDGGAADVFNIPESFTGTYGTGGQSIGNGYDSPELAGQQMGCWYSPSNGKYHFYSVLLLM